MMTIARGLIGLVFFCLVAWGLSSHRRKFPWRIVIFGLAMQALLGAVILGTDAGGRVFEGLSAFVQRLIEMAEPGAKLVFGPLSDPEAMEPMVGKSGAFILAFAGRGLVAIIFFSALMAVLYHLGVMQVLVYGLARLMSAVLGVSGAEAMAMAKTFHSFRHTWCENLYNQIGDIYGVSKAIGHSSVTVTQKYEHTGGMKVLEKAYKEKSVAQS